MKSLKNFVTRRQKSQEIFSVLKKDNTSMFEARLTVAGYLLVSGWIHQVPSSMHSFSAFFSSVNPRLIKFGHEVYWKLPGAVEFQQDHESKIIGQFWGSYDSYERAVLKQLSKRFIRYSDSIKYGKSLSFTLVRILLIFEGRDPSLYILNELEFKLAWMIMIGFWEVITFWKRNWKLVFKIESKNLLD